MKLTFDPLAASSYKSRSQISRVLTERWVHASVFCPNCGHRNIDRYPNNQPVADFFCSVCREDFELKSTKGRIGSRLVDGAYGTMMARLQSSANPNLFLLAYDLEKFRVLTFLVVPKQFFVPTIIEERKPLSPTARRAGWVGCNILLKNIPQAGKVFFIKNCEVQPRARVLDAWRKTLFLREEKESSTRGWLLDVMRCIERIGRREFTLDEVYSFEPELRNLYPGNKHIKAKIRQQLQVLRDRGYLEFAGRANYWLASTSFPR
jgi:type II restriction enzyme